MEQNAQQFWDKRYAVDGYIFGTEPNAFLATQRARFVPGQKALAVADGEGRNSVWMAEQGLDVLAVDISPIALDKARRLANERNVRVAFELADVSQWAWGENRFDVIAAIFIQFATTEGRTRIHATMQRALKPGGVVILQAYRPEQLQYGTGGPPKREMLYTADDLRHDFADLEMLHLREHDDEICEGIKHCGMSALVDMVARRPG